MSAFSKLNPNHIPPFDGPSLALSLVKKIHNEIPIQKAILFGSAAINRHDENSDLDIFLTVQNSEEIKLVYKIVQSPFFSPVAVDWIIKTESEFNAQCDVGGICLIVKETGKELSFK